ncbi:hypothetical protein OKA05_25050 [Luteolibacter arcticus]|uniref:PEP-CTERM sorting domain-containing protein n=1 Tax=Luteolibacter arcticus TaxID=1581411 RepID=A0ABT3GQP9_9BACT|nr:hypothetical protein [Luteolibacter arcticus]MCW1925851.1 hypothetical protein [Luteolibacter arcticus]
MIRPLVASLLLTAASAETVSWFSDPHGANVDSTGAPLNAAFQFQIGAFTGSFAPTASNAAQWAANWTAAETTSYNASNGLYDGQFTLENNAAPFTVNGKGWIWGFRNTSTGSEWILFRHTLWKWPAANPFNPPLIQWNARDANEVVLGAIHTGGSPFLMQTAAVSSYAQWSAGELAGETLDGPDDDPDHDGVTNLLEFSFGTPPLIAGPPPAMTNSWFESGGQRYLQLAMPRRRDRLALYAVEVSENLSFWQSGATLTAVMSDQPNQWIVRDLTPQGQEHPRRFLRFKATLP